MKFSSVFVLALIALLMAACVAAPLQTAAPASKATPAQPATPSLMPTTTAPVSPAAPSPTPAITPMTTAAVTPAVIPAGWQVYSNTAGFAISYPATWAAQAEPDSNNGSIHTEALKGSEGEVHLSWGVGFGGACPSGYAVVKVAQGDIQACYGKNENGTEFWSQMSRLLPNAGFSGRALTSNAKPASRDLILQVLSTLTFAPLPTGETTATPVATYSDPFAYCAAVGTIDTPDARYTSPKTPDSVLPLPIGPGTPSPFPEGSVYWRCMDGKVYSCTVGANIPCWDKADTSTTPNTGMQEFCQEQPNAEVIPAAAASRETIYEWSCKNGAPVMGKQVFQVDAQGYVTEYWQERPHPAATPTAATLQPLSAADCAALAENMANALGVKVTTGKAPISDWTTQQSGTACNATVTGTGKQFTGPDTVIKALAGMLEAQGWTEDLQLASGGPTGMGEGFRKGNQVCLAGAIWHPDASANCPKDQPISACQVTPEQQLYTVTLDCAQKAGAN